MSNNLTLKGILGLGKTSTLYYLNEIQERYQKDHQEFSTCPYLLYQIDFQDLNPFLPNQFDTLIPVLESYVCAISDLGISKLLVPNITLHETIDQIDLPFEICPAISALHISLIT